MATPGTSTAWRAVLRPARLDDAALRDAWRAFWISRAWVWLVGVAAVVAFGRDNPRWAEFDPLRLTSGYGAVGDALLAPAARWDAVWFAEIADIGYASDAGAAFFPLYPLLVWLCSLGGLVSPMVVGVLVSLAAFAVALYLLHRLATLEIGADAARLTVLLIALFPAAGFFSAVYSESLFLVLSVGAIYAARLGRWPLAGVAAMLAASTRSAGLVLLVPLALLWWRAEGRRLVQLAWLALVPVGLGAFMGWLALEGLSPMAPFDAQDVWLRSFAGPFVGAWDGAVAAWDGARQLLSGSRTPVYFDASGDDPFRAARHNLELFAFLVFAVVAVIGALRRLPLAYGAYCVAALALPLSYPVGPQPLMSLPRFLAVLFPLHMWLALWARDRRIAGWVVGASALGLAAVTARFATWHWVA